MMELWRMMNNMGNLVLAIFLLVCGIIIGISVVALIKTVKKNKDVVNEEIDEEDE